MPARPIGGRAAWRPGPSPSVERTFASVVAGLCGLALDRLRLSAERSHARRRQRAPETAGTHLRVGDMDIDLVGHNVSIEGRAAKLTTSEMRMLTFLAEQPGRARSRREILRHLWHTDHVGDERACDVHISNLRRKIERHPSRPERLDHAARVRLRADAPLGAAAEARRRKARPEAADVVVQRGDHIDLVRVEQPLELHAIEHGQDLGGDQLRVHVVADQPDPLLLDQPVRDELPRLADSARRTSRGPGGRRRRSPPPAS